MSDTPRPSSGLATFFHAALMAIAFAIFAYPIALPSGVVAGAVAAFAGVWLAEWLRAQRFRTGFVLLLGLSFYPLTAALRFLLIQSPLFAALVGPTAALALDDLIRLGAFAATLSLLLRTLALRFRAVLALEGFVVVLAVATTVSAHRDGMIARPLVIADWFWTQGLDPVVAFLGVGLIAALLLAAILADGRSPGRALLQLVVVLVLGFLLADRIHSRDPSAHRDVLGQNQKEKEQDENERGGQGGTGGDQSQPGGGDPQSGNRPRNQNDSFRDDMPRPGGSQEQRPAAVVVFHREVVPSGGIFYFRHAVFSQFNGVRMVQTSRNDVDMEGRLAFPNGPLPIPGAPPEIPERTTVATDVALLSAHQRPFGLIDAIELSPMNNPEPARFRRAFRVVSSVLSAPYSDLMGHEPGDPSWSEEIWRHYTEIPKDERYHRLAAELGGQLRAEFQSDPLARAMVIKRYLETNATYSFKKNYEGESDPTGAFLFSDDKRGYCVHLAHAAAYLMRAMGLPARVSAGYAVPQTNLGDGSSLLIKSNDAHAWAEIYLAEVGWVPIEVTPEKTDVEPTPFQERDLQQMLGEMARKDPPPEPDRGQVDTGQILRRIRQLLAYLPLLLAGLVLAAYAAKIWRIAAPTFAAPAQQPRLTYRAALDRLAAVGLVRRRGESRERFARRATPLAPSFSGLTEAHLSATFSRAGPGPEVAGLREQTARVAHEVRAAVPRWRWFAGALNPFSWMYSR